MVGLFQKIRSAVLYSAVTFIFALTTTNASAHVKWFAKYEISKPPLPITQVFTKTFIVLFIVSVVFNYLIFIGDRYIYRKGHFANLDERLHNKDRLANAIMRGSACLFFISCFLYHSFTGVTFILTPELKTNLSIIPWVHLLLGVSALFSATIPLVGIGIFGLYILSIHDYGLYHMLDYPIFLGIGYFFIVSNVRKEKWEQSRFVVLYILTGITLLWAAVEKWGYPSWTYPLLKHDPSLLLGMDPISYLELAGFVEFNLMFLLLSTASVLMRLVALGFMSMFVLAIAKFGIIDAIGHTMIIAILFVFIFRGPKETRKLIVFEDKAIWLEAYFMTGLYYPMFVTIFLMYYGFHYLSYGV